MIKHFLFTAMIVAPLLIYGQERGENRLDEKGRKTGWWTGFDNDGNKIYEGLFLEGHPIDTLRRYYPGGILKAIMVYDSTGTEVKAEVFDEKGTLRAEGTYKNQLKQGPWNFYGTNKIPLFVISYRNDSLEGPAIRFFANGNVMEKTHWSGNKMNGLQIVFSESGGKITEYNYKNGKLDGKYIVYNPDGGIAIIGYYKDNLKEGDWIYFNLNGDEEYRLNYSGGKLMNPEVLDERRREIFEQYEKNRTLIKDPTLYLSDPQSYFRK